MAPKRKSLKDKRRSAGQDNFIGRQAQVDRFRQNLQLGVDHDDFKNLFNTYGQGGVGKTTLVRHFEGMARQAGWAVAYLDLEDVKLYPVPACMTQLAESLPDGEKRCKSYLKKYHHYLERRSELTLGVEHNGSLVERIATDGIKMSIGTVAEFIPGGGVAREILPIDSLAEGTGRWINQAWGKLGNSSDVELVLHPLEELTPIWLEGINELAEQQPICLIFDNYETSNPELDIWLNKLLDSTYGDVPYNILVLVSGREPLDFVRWADFSDLLVNIPLEPFSVEEATAYLQNRGVSDPDQITAILSVSGRLPIFLSLFIESGMSADRQGLSYPTDRVVAHFLRNITQPGLKQLARLAAIGRRLDVDIVRRLLPEGENAQEGFQWLKNRPFVQQRAGHWTYHPVVRQQMIMLIREESQESWMEYHDKLADYYDRKAELLAHRSREAAWMDPTWITYRLEAHYHRLCSRYRQHLEAFFTEFLLVFQVRADEIERLHPWGEILTEAERDAGFGDWGAVFNQGLQNIIKDEGDHGLALLDHWLKAGYFQEHPEVDAFVERIYGYVYYKLGENEKSDAAYRRSVQIHPTNSGYRNLAYIAKEAGDYRQAEELLLKAVELPGYSRYSSLVDLASLYHFQLKDYEKAIPWHKKVVEEEHSDAQDLINLSSACQFVGRYEEGIQHGLAALEKDPENINCYINLCDAYGSDQNYEQAILYAHQALKREPDSYHAWHEAGLTLFRQKKYAEAAEYCEKAVTLNPDHYWAWNLVAACRAITGDMEASLAAVNQLSRYEGNEASLLYDIGRRYSQHQLWDKAIEWMERSLEIEAEQPAWRVHLAYVYGKAGRRETAIKMLKEEQDLDPTNNFTQDALVENYYHIKRFEDCIEQVNRILEQRDPNDFLLRFRGTARYELKQFTTARQDLLKAIELGDQHAVTRNVLGIIAQTNKDHEAALDWYDQVRALNPDFAYAYSNAGNSLVYLGRYEEAETLIKQAIELVPNDQYPRLSYAILLLKTGQYEQLLTKEQELTVDTASPAYTQLLWQLTKAAEKLGQAKRAIAFSEQALAINPDHQDHINQIAWVSLCAHDFSKAESYFLRYQKAQGTLTWTTAMNLGHIAFLTGDQGKALQLWKQAFQLIEDPKALKDGFVQDFKDLKVATLVEDESAYWELIKEAEKVRES